MSDNTADQETPKSRLNLVSKLSQRSAVDAIQAIDWERGSRAPLVVEFDPTTACNLACPDCISRDLLNQGLFSRTRIRELTKELVEAGVRAVILIGGGEPLAHPEIGWIIEYLGEHDVAIGLTTNGILLDRYQAQIAKYVSWTRVSMDAGTPATFQRIRPSRTGQSEFGKIIRNIQALSKVKTGVVGYSFMIYSEGKFDPALPSAGNFTNVGEIAEAAKVAKESGCDYFELKPMYDLEHFAIPQSEDLISKVEAEWERVLTLADESFRVLKATKLRSVLEQHGREEPKDYHRCAISELRTLITPSGVYVCPYFRGRPDKNIGDVRTQSFQEMWDGARRAQTMERLDPAKDCRMHCIRHDSNLFIEEMIRGDVVPDVVDDYDRFI